MFGLVLVASGCSTHPDEPGVAAKVDGIPITQAALTAAGASNDAARRQSQLEVFISEQVLSNAALQGKLDQEAAVAGALENARRQVLARAYISKQSAQLPQPASSEISAFFSEHPELFEHRRIYRLQEILVSKPPAGFAEVAIGVRALKTFNERAKRLQELGIPYTVAVTIKAAEVLPADLLPRLAEMKNGEAFELPQDGGIAFVQITGIEEQPLSLAQAGDFIRKYLFNQRLGAFINQETARLRKSAKIEKIPG